MPFKRKLYLFFLFLPFFKLDFQLSVFEFTCAILSVFLLGFLGRGVAYRQAQETDGMGGRVIHQFQQSLGER